MMKKDQILSPVRDDNPRYCPKAAYGMEVMIVHRKAKLAWLVWQIAHVGWCWFLYQELPHHMAKGRAKWSKYLRRAWEGQKRTSHRAGSWAVLPAMVLVAQLKQERVLASAY